MSKRPINMSRRAAIVDVAVVLTVAGGYVVAEALGVRKLWSYLGAAFALLAFGLFVWRRRPDTWRDLGFRTDNLRAAAPRVGIVTLAFAAVLAIWALALHHRIWSQQSTLLLALYPVWALVQQGVFQGVLHRRLIMLLSSRWAPTVLTALAFGAVHWGNPRLVALTLCAGTAWALLYRAWPNVWLLGASHSLLAALAYPAVIGDIPLSRF